MALPLGASIGTSTLQSSRTTVLSGSAAAYASRGRPIVVCQATFGAPKHGSQRVREHSPSKVQALAAPLAERQLVLPSPPTSPAGAVSNLLEVQRADLERLLHCEAAPSASEQAEVEQQQQQQPQQQHTADQVQDVTAPQQVAVLKGQQQQQHLNALAVSTSAREQQLVHQHKRHAQLTASTRQTRRSLSAAAATSQSAVGLQTGAARSAATANTTLTSWLLDCSSRRERGAKQPLALACPRPAAAQLSRTRRGAAAEPGPVRLEAAALEGLSNDTKQDMAVLINTRSALKYGRTRRRSAARFSGPSDSMSSLLRGLGNTAVLSRQQEAALAVVLQRGIHLRGVAEQLAAKMGCQPSEVSDEAVAAAAGLPSAADVAQRRANQREAKDLLMQYNVRLVINIAKRYSGNGIDIADLIPEGMVGLSKSLDRFEPSKGFRFSTYAHWWIRQSISRAVVDQARVVRLPSHVCESLYRINRAVNSLMEQSQSDEMPSYEQIAAEVGLPVRRVIHYLRLSRLPGSSGQRDRPSGFLFGSSLKAVQFEVHEELAEDEDPTVEGEEEDGQYESIRQMTDLLLSTLEKRERNILRLRYGLLGLNQQAGSDGGLDSDGGVMSLGEVASAYGLSKERIRQIEDKAMRALRKPWRQQLAREIRSGQPVGPGNLSHLASARHLVEREAIWPRGAQLLPHLTLAASK